jgi:hypothetical protein
LGEQSATYRGLFALSKSFGIADTTVAIAQGIANSAKLGWPQNIPAIAATISQTAGLLSMINSGRLWDFKAVEDLKSVGQADQTRRWSRFVRRQMNRYPSERRDKNAQ